MKSKLILILIAAVLSLSLSACSKECVISVLSNPGNGQVCEQELP